ncbi:MAG: hypothetical protein HXX11_16635 [Desulfuromonadales bacterium]|nr:hypothetical protein [Desulfuromonadales bacterium]
MLAESMESCCHWKARNAILAMTYMVVVFFILVQGLTLGKLARWFYPGSHERDDA